VGHERETGDPCDRHVARVEDLVAPATLGVSCFGALHDLASALQAIGAAVEELDAAITDPALRSLVQVAIEANDRAIELFVASRNILRDPAGRKTRIAVSALIDRAGQRSARRPVVGSVAPGSVEVAVPVIAHVLASILAAADGADEPARITAVAADDGRSVAIVVSHATTTPLPSTIGTTLAIAAHAVETHGGSVRCGTHDGREAYTIVLPLAP